MILTVCNTCKRPGFDPDTSSETDGTALARLISAEIADDDPITFREHACLMGCDFGCNVAMQAPGKLTYSLGTFEPTEDAAAGIVAFARLYAASETGQVPYKQWPQAIKGHFRTRIPPIPTSEPPVPDLT